MSFHAKLENSNKAKRIPIYGIISQDKGNP